MSDRILLSPPHLAGDELVMLGEALDSGWVALVGPQVDAFEAELAASTGVTGALATSSGTAAIHLALDVLDVTPGDTILCSSLTFIGSASPIRYCGADPIFIDADPATWNMDPNRLAEALRDLTAAGVRPKAVLVVDIFGQAADYDAITRICDEYEVPIVEDAAESLGGTYRGAAVGSFGRVAALSFNGNKIITTSGGGALLSNDESLVERAHFLANQAQDPAPHYQHSMIGYNYRLSNLLAAVGRSQLRQLPDRVDTKRAIFDRYVNGLGDLPGFTFMPEARYGRATRWLTTLTIDPAAAGISSAEVRQNLELAGIESRPVWKPMHLQPVFADCLTFGGAVSQHLFDTGLCLPSGVGLTLTDQERVIAAIRTLVHQRRS